MRDVLIVAVVFVLIYLAGPSLGLPMTGPLAVLAAGALALWRCRRAGENRESLGLQAPRPWWAFALQVLAALLVGYAMAVAAALLGQALGWPPAGTGRLGELAGNLPRLLGMLVIAWTSAALGEEWLFRGFLQARLQHLFGGLAGAGLLAALVQSLLFGLAHAYQGPGGVLLTGAIGLGFGLLRLRLRTLWPLVLAHGLIDSISLVALYAGAMPAQPAALLQ